MPRLSAALRLSLAAVLTIAAIGIAVATSLRTARAAPADEVVGLYERFAEAQNRHDLAAVRALLLPSDRFLWVSDGKAFWGPDAMLERMARFQQAAVWEVEPDRIRRRVVEVAGDRAHLFQPLVLRIGAAGAPDRIPFLVSVLCERTAEGWRIAALLTTVEKP